MRLISFLAIALVFPAGGSGQGLNPRPQGPQHATVATAVSASTVAPGQAITLWADVTPRPGIHIYAAGAAEFTPVSLTLIANPGVKGGTAKYPPADRPQSLKATDLDAPAYYSKFRIAQPVTIASSTADKVVISGLVSYQACDDRLCYPVASEPVSWTLTLK